jgi:hypothetical protein
VDQLREGTWFGVKWDLEVWGAVQPLLLLH